MISVILDQKKIENWENLGLKIKEMLNYGNTREKEPGLIQIRDTKLNEGWSIKTVNPFGTIILTPNKGNIEAARNMNNLRCTMKFNQKYKELEIQVD
jgi:hypothetical protein